MTTQARMLTWLAFATPATYAAIAFWWWSR